MSEPAWWKLLNVEADQFERTEYADSNNPGKFRLKDLGVLRQLSPGLYESAAEEVKEYNEFLAYSNKNIKKVKLGKKIGSIPMIDACLHPELMNDRKSQDKYWQENPQFKVNQPQRYV